MDEGPDHRASGAAGDLLSSIELLRRARAGDETALDGLLRRFEPRLRRWTTGRLPRFVREMVDTDDMIQDVLLGTLRHLARFEPEHDGALLAYMRRAMRNRIQDEQRRVGRRPVRGELPADAPAATISPMEETIGIEAHERYERALAQLDDTDRQAVICRVEMDMSYAEIARAMDKPSPDAARMAVSRALVRLAAEMGHG